jgi:anthranilate synthase component 1
VQRDAAGFFMCNEQVSTSSDDVDEDSGYYLINSLSSKADLLKLYYLDPKFYSVLLESVSCPQDTDCFDVLLVEPQQQLCLDADNNLYYNDRLITDHHFLNFFEQLCQQYHQPESHSYYPFSGGWFLFLAYEFNAQIEPALTSELSPNISSNKVPIAYARRYENALIYDHSKQQWILFCLKQENYQRISAKLKQDLLKIAEIDLEQRFLFHQLEEDCEDDFIAAIAKIKQYIIDGDVFQVNLSRQWKMIIETECHHHLSCYLYHRLRQANPAPFAALVSFYGYSILSSSPERLVKVKNRQIESRPIAGTHPRAEKKGEDERLKQQLHQHPKEQSEHIMLIDLIRNDLGRVCRPGSIVVNEFMINESYQYVHHIVSNIQGELEDGISPADIIAAVFPGGTITGCPKVRCMEIIQELEQQTRQAYTGTLGYINDDGSMDLNILIRSMTVTDQQQQQLLQFRAGAGIVNDSKPEKELQETRNKARGMLKSLCS